MKKMICTLLLLLLFSAALCEGTIVDNITVHSSMSYACDDFSMMLPGELHVLEADERAGYDAAILGDYPASAPLTLMAVDEARTAAVCVALYDTDKSCEEAARGAAKSLLGKDDGVLMTKFGESDCACFACAIGGKNYNIYVFGGAGRLACVGICGLDDDRTTSILSSFVLNAQ